MTNDNLRMGMAVLLIVLCVQFGQTVGAQDPDLERRVNQTVRELGVLESASTIDIRSPIESRILFIATQGSNVRRGDLILELEASDLENQRNEQKVKLAKAKASLIAAETVVKAANVEATSSVRIAEMAVQIAELALDGFQGPDGEITFRTRELDAEIDLGHEQVKVLEAMLERKSQEVASDIAKEQEILEGELALKEAKAKIEVAETHKKWLQQHVRLQQTATLKYALAKAQFELGLAKTNLEIRVDKAEADLSTAETVFAVESDKLKALEAALAACQVKAPIDGLVVYPEPASSRGVRAPLPEKGAMVRSQQTIIRIVDMRRLQLNVNVHETTIRRVRVGQPVSIRFEAGPRLVIDGTVSRINTTPKPANWMETGGKEYSVLVSIEDPPESLLLGMTGMAEIEIAD